MSLLPRGGNAASIKQGNRALILRALREEGSATRIDLSRRTGLSKGGLTPIIGDLLALGLVREREAEAADAARRSIPLTLNPERCYAISVDWTRSHVLAALVDMGGRIVCTSRFEPTPQSGWEDVLRTIGDMACRLRAQCENTVIGLCLVAPGPLDIDKGLILSPPNFHGWQSIPVTASLRDQTGLPVFLDNNAAAHVLAEKNHGHGLSYGSFVHIIVDEGIGGGAVANGQLLRGHYGGTGEFGHITLDMGGPLCACGNHGCAELYASISRMLASVNEKLRHAYLNDAYEGPLNIDFDTLIKLADGGNRLCAEALGREALYLANLCVTLANLYEPQAIVLGSDIARAGGRFTRAIEAALNGKTMLPQDVPILVSTLRHPSIIGGASAVFDRFIDGAIGAYEDVLA